MRKNIQQARVVFKSSAEELDGDILWTERVYCVVCDADFIPHDPAHDRCPVCRAANAYPSEIPCLELRP